MLNRGKGLINRRRAKSQTRLEIRSRRSFASYETVVDQGFLWCISLYTSLLSCCFWSIEGALRTPLTAAPSASAPENNKPRKDIARRRPNSWFQIPCMKQELGPKSAKVNQFGLGCMCYAGPFGRCRTRKYPCFSCGGRDR